MKKNILITITLNERVEREAATRPDILHFTVREILLLSGISQRTLKMDVCGNRENFTGNFTHTRGEFVMGT